MQRNKNSKIAPMEIIMSTKIISLLFFTITSGKQVSSFPQILQISPFSYSVLYQNHCVSGSLVGQISPSLLPAVAL